MSQSVSIPSIGLTFTPVEAPKPVTVQPRGFYTFQLGDRVVSSFTPHASQYIVIGREDGSGRMLLSVSTGNKYYDINTFLNKDSFYHVGDIDADGKPKTIPATTPPLVSYDELKCGQVGLIRSHVGGTPWAYIYKGHFDDECMWWYANVNMAMRPMSRYNDNDGGFGFKGGAKVFEVVGTLSNTQQ